MRKTECNSGARYVHFDECEALRQRVVQQGRQTGVTSDDRLARPTSIVWVDSFQPAPIVVHVVTPLTPDELKARSRLPYGQRIRDLRKALGWTQHDAAKHLGISVRTVIRHERNQSLRMHWTPLWKLREVELTYAADLAVWLHRRVHASS